ncbi:rolling circle replication-associated protein, partial [Clostridium perfringens]
MISSFLLSQLLSSLKPSKNLKYLWVLEFGTKNQRLHYHLLTNI